MSPQATHVNAQVVIYQDLVPYREGLHLQDDLVVKRQADEIPDTLLMLEHTPVITLGIRAKQEHVLLSPEVLSKQGIEVVETPRGGDVTYHGPGQLVLYPIMKLTGAEADAHAFVNRLEDIAILTADAFQIHAYRRKGKTGVWTNDGKLAAIGVRFKKWVSSHGMSFNVEPDLAGFGTIIPCGLHGERVTSLKAIMGDRCPSLREVRAVMMRQFERVMNRTLLVTPEPDRCR